MQTLYVTTHASVYRADMLSSGHRPMRMSSDKTKLKISGGKASFDFVATPFDKGRPYIVLASGTGTSPGFVVAGTRIPLQLDAFTDLSSAAANSPVFSTTLGSLDAAGAGKASFNLPAVSASFVGLHLRFAVTRFRPFDGASNAIELSITR